MVTKDEHRILSNHLINKIDFDKVYDDSPDSSKMNFNKDTIINSIKKMISTYPHFDNSIEGRIESFTLLFNVRKGTLNNYMYFIYEKKSEFLGWYISMDSGSRC